jgi:hypothetical protein
MSQASLTAFRKPFTSLDTAAPCFDSTKPAVRTLAAANTKPHRVKRASNLIAWIPTGSRDHVSSCVKRGHAGFERLSHRDRRLRDGAQRVHPLGDYPLANHGCHGLRADREYQHAT